MRTSQAIKRLQRLQRAYGDLEVGIERDKDQFRGLEEIFLQSWGVDIDKNLKAGRFVALTWREVT